MQQNLLINQMQGVYIQPLQMSMPWELVLLICIQYSICCLQWPLKKLFDAAWADGYGPVLSLSFFDIYVLSSLMTLTRPYLDHPMEQHTLKNVDNCLNANTYYYLETSGGQCSNLYLNVVHFSTSVLIIHLWQLMTVVFLDWCLIRAVLVVSV